MSKVFIVIVRNQKFHVQYIYCNCHRLSRVSVEIRGRGENEFGRSPDVDGGTRTAAITIYYRSHGV